MDPCKNAQTPPRNVLNLSKHAIALLKTYNFGKISMCSHNKLLIHRRLIIKISETLVIVVNFGSRDSLHAYIA